MKHLVTTVIALLVATLMYAQDFSYVKEVELNNTDQIKDAEEDVLECCYYLVAARYDKKDTQRIYATNFVSRWLSASFDEEKVLNEKISVITEGREELNNLYLIYYALNYIENEGQVSSDELREAAFAGLIEFCDNPINKIKLTKELKGLKQVIEEGKLSAYLQK